MLGLLKKNPAKCGRIQRSGRWPSLGMTGQYCYSLISGVRVGKVNVYNGRHQNFREIPYLYIIVKIDGGRGLNVYLYRWISLFPVKKGNSTVKIDGGGGQDVYLYNVKIGNFPEILISSLIRCILNTKTIPPSLYMYTIHMQSNTEGATVSTV